MYLDARLDDGQPLQRVTLEQPVLLLFLRHFGCIFCREMVGDVSRILPELQARGVKPIIVHQGTPEEGQAFLQEVQAAPFSLISDPERRLYDAFDLRRGNLRQMFGIPIWPAYGIARKKGHSMGRLVNDIYQMPGCFLLRDGRVLAAFPYEYASDRPNYLEFVDAALKSDPSLLMTLRPDGSLVPLTQPPLDPWSGQPDERPRLLLVGGNGSTPDRFRRCLPALSTRLEPRVVEVAGQGGRSTVPLPDSLDGFARDLAKQLELAAEHLQQEGAGGPIYLYGHGVGALLLARSIRHLSFRPARLVLHAPVGVFLEQRRLPRLFRLPGTRRFAQWLLSQPFLGVEGSRTLFDSRGMVDSLDRERFAAGYARATSFSRLFELIHDESALDGLDALRLPIVLLWGARDSVLDVSQLPAWAERFPHAPVLAHVEPTWKHYPYLDAPRDFAQCLQTLLLDPAPFSSGRLESLATFSPSTKPGRLRALSLAGLPTPQGWLVPERLSELEVARLVSRLPGNDLLAVRSSARQEDQHTGSSAGLFRTELDVPRDQVAAAVLRVRASQPEGRGDVLLMPMARRTVGGVAWVRALGVDLELGEGGAEAVVEGRAGLTRVHLSPLGPPWHQVPDQLPGGLSPKQLERDLFPLLQKVLALFDVRGLDVEWCFHPDTGFTLLQARPLVEGLSPHRLLSSANIEEIVPPVPGPLLLEAAEANQDRLPAYYGRFEPWLKTLREPFTQVINGRYYLNLDLFAALFQRWGLPGSLLARQVGGGLPSTPLRPLRLLRSLPALFRLLLDQSRLAQESRALLERLEMRLLESEDAPALADWFEVAYREVVTGNFRITGALSSAVPLVKRGPAPVTLELAEALRAAGSFTPELQESWGHRCVYESDPAWPRADHPAVRPVPRPRLPDPLDLLSPFWRRLPWFFPRHLLAHREWFRDSAMRLWAAYRSRLTLLARRAVDAGHLQEADSIFGLGLEALRQPPSEWKALLAAHRPATPTRMPTLFWAETLEALAESGQTKLMIYPGVVEGQALVARTPEQALKQLKWLKQTPILVVSAVDPGWLPVFLKVGGVVTELGGRLSHAAVLLQELKIPTLFNLDGIAQKVRTADPIRLSIPPGTVTPLEPPPAASPSPH